MISSIKPINIILLDTYFLGLLYLAITWKDINCNTNSNTDCNYNTNSITNSFKHSKSFSKRFSFSSKFNC